MTGITNRWGLCWISGMQHERAITIVLAPPWPLLLAAIPGACWIGLMLFRAMRSSTRSSTGLCPVCGYDLRASTDRCPECGAVISSSI